MSKNEPAAIWLMPHCIACSGEDRQWCQDNVWAEGCECGRVPVKYIFAPDQPQPMPKPPDGGEITGG